ncbi:MAG TPA: C1 family peptidase [Candidatus Methanofastidiosa archaeon]|nr:C1 family peptidase [Candidatus Methanofastidiosa archaeon]
MLSRPLAFAVIAALLVSLLFIDNIDISANENQTFSISIVEHKATARDIEYMKSMDGVYDPDTDYNVIIDGHGTGLVPPTEEEWESMVGSINIVDEISLEYDGPLPTSLDLSSSKYFPPIGDQDGEGSCVAWAVGYYTKTFQEALEHGWDLSGAVWVGGTYGHPSTGYQDKIFSPDFLYHQVNRGRSDAGSSYSDIMEIVTNTGASTWSTMPYDPLDSSSWPSEAAWREAALYRGQDGFNVYYFNSDVDALKNLLLSGNLGVISINASYYAVLTGDDVWTTDNYTASTTNHANTVVGFDDSFSYTEGGVVKYGAFKVANSWGTGWNGDHNSDGYYWISYEAMRTGVGKFMFTNDIADYNPETIAVFEIDHEIRTDCEVYVGIGDPNSPVATKSFTPYYYGSGDYPFPDNKIVLDITEFGQTDEDFFLKVFDYEGYFGSSSEGVIVSFSVEEYTNYDVSGNADMTWTATDTPISTINGGYVHSIAEYYPSLDPPLLSYPSQTNTLGAVAPLFSWDEVEYAYTYNFEISTSQTTGEDGSFSSVIYADSTSGPGDNTFIRPGVGLAEGVYYWHVQAVGENANMGPWSDTWTIEIISGTTFLFNSGWSLWSFPYLPSSTDLDTLLSGLEGYIDYVYRWNPDTDQYEYSHYIEELGWVGEFDTVDGNYGFWFHSTSAEGCDLHITDGTPDTASIYIHDGWNLVNWPKKGTVSLDEALQDVSGYIDYVYRWNPFLDKYEYSHYIETLGWQGEFDQFEPGYGYWFHSSGDCTWSIP